MCSQCLPVVEMTRATTVKPTAFNSAAIRIVESSQSPPPLSSDSFTVEKVSVSAGSKVYRRFKTAKSQILVISHSASRALQALPAGAR